MNEILTFKEYSSKKKEQFRIFVKTKNSFDIDYIIRLKDNQKFYFEDSVFTKKGIGKIKLFNFDYINVGIQINYINECDVFISEIFNFEINDIALAYRN